MQRSKLLKASATGGAAEDTADFSLVLGGPLYQLYLRTTLLKPHLVLSLQTVISDSSREVIAVIRFGQLGQREGRL